MIIIRVYLIKNYEYLYPGIYMGRAYMVSGSVTCLFDVLFVSVKPVVPAIWVSPEHVWRQFFHHLALSLTLTRTTTTNWNYGISWPSSQPLNPFTPWRSMCAGDSRHAWGAPCIYSLHLITPPLRKHLRNAAVIPGFCAGGHGLTMKCWWWRCCCTHLVRP